MIDKIIAKAFINAMRSSMKELDNEDEEHHFDANSERCKTCKDFNSCSIFAAITNKIDAADVDEKIKVNLGRVILFFRTESIILDDDIKFDKIELVNLIERFYSIKECKNLPVLVAILNKAELKYLRNIIFKVNAKIEKELNKVIDANRAEYNYFMKVLSKPENEDKRYEDMTREELLEELKNK